MGTNVTTLNFQLTQLPSKHRESARIWAEILSAFEKAGDKTAAEVELRDRYSHQIKFSTATLYRKLAAWKRCGLAGLFPLAAQRRMQEASASFPPEFLRFWMKLCAQNQRKTAPAWRGLIEDYLRAGKSIPGYDKDWRGIWQDEHVGWAVPARCPYSRQGGCLPAGWSERNLRRHALSGYQQAATRQGTAAARNFLPMIPTTRVGLPFGRVYTIDDVEHDVLVTFLGNVKPQGVVELGALELLTGHYCSWGAKPVRERSDGTREKLQEDYNRYLIAHICCVIGFSYDGCLICGEHGTAKLPKSLRETLDRLSGGLVEFSAGGILNKPIAKGLYLGLSRGNFRFKAALESHHNLKHNELASLLGQKGAKPEKAPEDLERKKAHHKSLMKACVALAGTRPDLIGHLASPFPPYHQYMEAVALLYDRIAERTDHAMEGWDENGFIRQEWKLPGDPLWRPMDSLAELDLSDREAILGVIRRNPTQCMRTRRMSPQEAYEHCRETHKDRLTRLPDFAVPEILGPTLADHVDVSKQGTMSIPDRYLANHSSQVAALVKHPDGTVDTLNRGQRVMVWLSPYDSRAAYISNSDGVYLGKAPVMVPGTKIDMGEWHRNVAVLNAMESTELKRLAPVAEARMREHIQRKETNIKALTGKEPADIITSASNAAAVAADADDAILELGGSY